MTEEELAHFGVLGMKWGHRQAANGKQIKAARARLKDQSTAYRKEAKKLDGMAEGSAKRKLLEKKLQKQHQDYLKNPDRVIAARMTRGEKFLALMSSGETPVTAGIALGVIASTSLASRRIEFKQQNGGYNKAPKTVHKHLGLQKARGFAVNGALIAPGLLRFVGETGSMAIAGKAAANRNAAKLVKPSIGSTAAKLKYAAKRGGVHKITTLK